MKNKKILIISIGIFLAIGTLVFAKHLCTDQPLEHFTDGTTEKTVAAHGGMVEGPHFRLPTNSQPICFAKIKIDFTGGAVGGVFTPYVWVPVSGESKLVQIRTSDGSIVRTFYNGDTRNCSVNAFSDPSRITTMPGGDIWVANRANGTVTRIGRMGTCPDPANPDDCFECKGTYSDVGDAPRGVTYDANGNVWVGAHTTERICTYRSDGTLINCNNNSGCKTYGMIGDKSGNVYISDRANGKLCQCSNPSNPTCVTVGTLSPEAAGGAYGIGIDNDDHVWVVKNAYTGEFCEYIPSTNNLRCGMFTGAGVGAGYNWGKARGIAVDTENNVWVAASSDNTVRKFDQNGTPLCNPPIYLGPDIGPDVNGDGVTDGQGPIGIAIDGENNAWVVFHGDPGIVYKISKNCQILASTTVGSVPAWPDFPYNYSDMTGLRTPITGAQIGTGGAAYSFTLENFPITICSQNRPEIGCDQTDPHVKVDPGFATSVQNILANCSGGTQIPEESWCGNPMCDVPIYIASYYTSGQFTISDLRIEWTDPPSNLKGGLVPCGRLCDDPDTPIFEDCPCRLCDFLILGDKIVKFALFRIAVPIAVLMVVIGGAMFLSAGGSPEKISSAKNLIKNVVFGMVIIFAAWIIVNTIFMLVGLAHWTGPAWAGLEQAWWKIDCPVPGNYFCTPPGGGAPVVCTQDTTKSTPNYCKLPWEP